MSYQNSNTNELILDVHEKPESYWKWALLSLQHVFGMFSATILVPLLTGLDTGVALIASGVGTLIYIAITKKKVPIYLGSSFAYIAAITFALENGGEGSAFTALMGIGLVYAVVSTILIFTGTGWLNRLLPPVVIGPVIIVIGLNLASVAVDSLGISEGNSGGLMIGLVTFTAAVLIALRGRGFFRIIPFMLAILIGYLVSVFTGDVNLVETFAGVSVFTVPSFTFLGSYGLDFSMVPLFLPLAFVTIAEHIGDHKVLGEITNKDYVEDPGLSRTLLGDGVATFVSAMMGGPANTSYGENTGIIAMNRVASVYVIMGAAAIAVLLGFSGHVQAFILSIPSGIIGGITVILYGFIAANGIKVLLREQTDMADSRNLIIISVILVIGLGGAVIEINDVSSVSGMALATTAGILLNLVLPRAKNKETLSKQEL
ncbi:MAG: uracil-xanthine permease family protein [Bacillota bacterium]